VSSGLRRRHEANRDPIQESARGRESRPLEQSGSRGDQPALVVVPARATVVVEPIVVTVDIAVVIAIVVTVVVVASATAASEAASGDIVPVLERRPTARDDVVVGDSRHPRSAERVVHERHRANPGATVALRRTPPPAKQPCRPTAVGRAAIRKAGR
jgi:hypothetical protein